MLKFKFFGNKCLLAGVTHNSPVSLEFIQSILDSYQFDYYLVELNKDNSNFIKRNNFKLSEFFPIIEQCDRKSEYGKTKLKLIDMDIKSEIRLFFNDDFSNPESVSKTKYSSHLENNYVHYHLQKFLFYKIKNLKVNGKLYNQNLVMKNVDDIHIKERENYMNNQIVKYLNKGRILIVVGINHYDVIENFILKTKLI